jgi:hypothetical protein
VYTYIGYDMYVTSLEIKELYSNNILGPIYYDKCDIYGCVGKVTGLYMHLCGHGNLLLYNLIGEVFEAPFVSAGQ